jgi:hypothetical protein
MSLRETHPIGIITMKHNSIYRSWLVNNSIVYEYFKLMKDKNINRLLNLFADDAIIHEPFSNIDVGLKGKSAIKPFLEIAMMANEGMQQEIEFEKPRISNHNHNSNNHNNKNQVAVLVTFERGGRVHARFTFELATESDYNMKYHRKKIQTLRIEFIE